MLLERVNHASYVQQKINLMYLLVDLDVVVQVEMVVAIAVVVQVVVVQMVHTLALVLVVESKN